MRDKENRITMFNVHLVTKTITVFYSENVKMKMTLNTSLKTVLTHTPTNTYLTRPFLGMKNSAFHVLRTTDCKRQAFDHFHCFHFQK